tara:strand:- start:6944 stop:8329 length:1386 start_codon:yes stop_codon:yes gene_type:complete
MAIEKFEVIVIGGGSAGKWVAENVAYGGKTALMIESRMVGGECPYFACMPAKAMLHSAEIRHNASKYQQFGHASKEPIFDNEIEGYAAAVAIRHRVAEHLDDTETAERFLKSGAKLIRGKGLIQKDGIVEVNQQQFAYDDLVLATGTEFNIPPINGLDKIDFWTSDDFYTSQDLPKSLTIIGGGPVGLEIAQIAHRFGAEVHVLEVAANIMPAEDHEIALELQDLLISEGINIHPNIQIADIVQKDNVEVKLQDGQLISSEKLLIAAGKRNNLNNININNLELSVDPFKPLPVDKYLKVIGTKNVWAGGDITGIAPYTHTANYHGRIITSNLLGQQIATDHSAVPRGLFTDPEVASVGISEEKAQSLGLNYAAASHPFGDTARGFATRKGSGRLKLIADVEKNILLGASVVGPNAGEIIGEAVLAMQAKISITEFAKAIHPFPTYTEAYEPPLRELATKIK